MFQYRYICALNLDTRKPNEPAKVKSARLAYTVELDTFQRLSHLSQVIPFWMGEVLPYLTIAIWSLQELDRCGWQYHFLHRSSTSEPIITNPNCEGNGWKATVIGCDEQCFVVYNGIASMIFSVLSLLKWGSLVGLSAIHCQCWHSKGFYVW